MTDCSVSIDELNHDLSSKELTIGDIADRTDEILGECSNPASGYYTVMEDAIIQDSEIMSQVMELAWQFRPCVDVDRQSLRDVRHLALKAQVIVDRINRIAEGYAREELEA